jgi:hypothetical protein
LGFIFSLLALIGSVAITVKAQMDLERDLEKIRRQIDSL